MKLPLDSLFSSESYVFPVGFLYVLKRHHVRLFIVKKNRSLEWLLDDVGFISNHGHYCKILAISTLLKL